MWTCLSLSAVSSLGKNNCTPGNDVKVAALMEDVPEGASGRIQVAMVMLTQAEAGSSIWYPLACLCAYSTLPCPQLCSLHCGSGL